MISTLSTMACNDLCFNLVQRQLNVFEFLEEKELEDESYKETKLLNVKGEVTFDHVKFGYDEEKLVIKDFSAKIKPGQKVAIVGPTGAGKTTLVNLLMRFYDLNEGRILIDGVDIKDITRENVHSLFGMVLQDTWLFKVVCIEITWCLPIKILLENK